MYGCAEQGQYFAKCVPVVRSRSLSEREHYRSVSHFDLTDSQQLRAEQGGGLLVKYARNCGELRARSSQI